MAGPNKTVNARFNVITGGLVIGFIFGIYLLKDYQLIKYSPPSADNFDSEGNWKHKTFFTVKFTDRPNTLELKPEAVEKLQLRKLQQQNDGTNNGGIGESSDS